MNDSTQLIVSKIPNQLQAVFSYVCNDSNMPKHIPILKQGIFFVKTIKAIFFLVGGLFNQDLKSLFSPIHLRYCIYLKLYENVTAVHKCLTSELK